MHPQISIIVKQIRHINHRNLKKIKKIKGKVNSFKVDYYLITFTLYNVWIYGWRRC